MPGHCRGVEGADDRPGDGGCGEYQSRLVVDPFHKGIRLGAGQGVEKDHRQGNGGQLVRVGFGMQHEEDRHQHKPAPGADQSAVGPYRHPQTDKPEIFRWANGSQLSPPYLSRDYAIALATAVKIKWFLGPLGPGKYPKVSVLEA